MKSRKKWTKEERIFLVKTVLARQTNLSKGFKIAALDLNRSETACRLEWYKVTDPNNKNYIGAGYLTVSNMSYSINRKNDSANININKSKSLWEKIKSTLKITFFK